MKPGKDDLLRATLEWVNENNLNRRNMTGKIEATTDLLATGVLDSVGFVQLLTFLEARLGYEIDLLEIDTQDFTTAQGLCRHALSTTG